MELATREVPPRGYTESWLSGGFVVRIAGHPVPVSHHDTEEGAMARAAAYERGGFAATQDRSATQ